MIRKAQKHLTDLQRTSENTLNVPLFDHSADCSGDLLSKQPGLPTLRPYCAVTSEEWLQSGGLVPAHQQLRLRVPEKPTDIGWNVEESERLQLKGVEPVTVL